MPNWNNELVVHAPLEKVCEYMDDVTAIPEWLPSMVEVRNVIGVGAGQQYDWSYKMAGLMLHGQTIVVDHVSNGCAAHQFIGTINAVWEYLVEPHEDGTLLKMTLDYSVPMPVLGRLAEHVARNRIVRESNAALLNVKELMEAT